MRHENSPSRKITLCAKDLRVVYGETVALHIDALSVTGGVVGIIGHNGSGKSTFLKTTLGLLTPRHGALVVRDAVSGNPFIPEQHMAFSPETGAVFLDLPVESYIRLWCRIKRRDGRHYLKTGARIMERLHLEPLLPKLGRELSKGERRRVQIAVGFLSEPQLFCFDEPFEGLDVLQSALLSEIMLEASERMALIISSHRMDIVEHLAERIVVLKEGRVFALGDPAAVAKTLCPERLVIITQNGVRERIPEILPALRHEVPQCFFELSADELSVLGEKVAEEVIRRFFSRNGLSEIEISRRPPSLSQAMNFHLSRGLASCIGPGNAEG